jgi:hypothetical protein
LMHLASARVLARALGRNGLGRVHVSRRSGRGSGASVSWRVLHETKNSFFISVLIKEPLRGGPRWGGVGVSCAGGNFPFFGTDDCFVGVCWHTKSVFFL